MTIVSKANLSILKSACTDSDYPELNCMLLAEDGSTVVCDRFTTVAVSPVPSSTFFPELDRPQLDAPSNGVSIPIEVVQKTLRNIPKGGGSSSSPMQFAALTTCGQDRVGFTTVDRHNQESVSGRRITQPFVDWKNVFESAWDEIQYTRFSIGISDPQYRACMSLRRLIQILQTMDAASESKSGDALVLIDFAREDNAIVLRTHNAITDQDIIGVIRPVTVHGDVWKLSRWVQSVYNTVKSAVKKIKPPRRKR